jgi:geranylgeranyl pyrophosphate synthase
LACAVAHDLGGGVGGYGAEKALSSAVALELLHAASLVHDDLPALDNDDTRRGRASCHKAFGEATAILTGDALIGAAFMVLTSDAAIPSDTQARVARILSHAWWDLCLGQQFDIERQRGSETTSRAEMIRLKTGALFGAAVGCGAVCAGIREAILEDYVVWGTRVGECFQALDDLDDGDRLPDEREAVTLECLSALKSASDLSAKLAGGVTHALVASILGDCDTCE